MSQPAQGNGNKPDSVAVYNFALILTALWFISLFFLGWYSSQLNETNWTRLVTLYDDFAAIVFAAIGWVFGREVNRFRAESAEKNLQEATKTAINSSEEAKKLQIRRFTAINLLEQLQRQKVTSSDPIDEILNILKRPD